MVDSSQMELIYIKCLEKEGTAMSRKTYQELSLIDNYYINAIASNEEIKTDVFRLMLTVLLEKEIGKINVIAERMIPGITPENRGIRMDVEISETEEEKITNVYDIEPHKQNDLDFPRHNRFYAAKIDGRYVKSGLKDFSKIPNLYVITITNFDIFGEDKVMYTFKNKCKESPKLEYDDGLTYIYFYTKGKIGGSQSIRNMLRYIEDSHAVNVVDEATEQMNSYVEVIRKNPVLEGTYMTLGDLFDREKEAGRIEASIELILIKMRKNYSVSQIAADIEKSEEYVQKIYDRIIEIGIDVDTPTILEKVLQMQN